jgi:hypothetical protein
VAAKTRTPPHEVASRAEEAWRAASRLTWDTEGSPA